MQDLLAQLLLILKGAWRYRWVGVATAWALALLGWLMIQLIPDRFESQTTVYVDTESLLRPLLKGLAVDRDVMSEVSMMQAVMLSRPNLERVARKSDMLLAARTPEEQAAVVDGLQASITLDRSVQTRRGSQPNTFTIRYIDADPRRSQRVVQTLLDTFMEDSLGFKQTDTGTASRFLEARLQDYEQRLNEAESRLAEFKRDNVGVLPGDGGDYFSRMQEEGARLETLRGRALQLSQRRAELLRQLEGEEPTFGLVGGGTGSPVDAQIASLQGRIDQLLTRYTDKHPEVVALQEQIVKLEADREAGKTGDSAPRGVASTDEALARSLDMNPVYQNIRISLSSTEAELAELRGEIAAQEASVGRLRSRVDAIPAVEAELKRLTRDYEVQRDQYNTMLQRIESARISTAAEQSTDEVKFRVINPPVVPGEAAEPDRRLLSFGVLLISVLAGLGLAMLLAQIRPAIHSRQTLRNVTGLPVIGSVSMLMSRVAVPWYRSQSALVGGALGLLVLAWLVNLLLSDALQSAARSVIG
jgi:polysaccharide chain length determinant protein (PEP-CTERM system associated)